MRYRHITASAILLATIAEAKHGTHSALEALHRRHRHGRDLERAANETLERRGGTCAFPTDAGLVAVTPGSGNGGWAFAPDQSCTVGRYCPYACPPGQVSMQWDPTATSYSYPQSMNGGLLCNSDGTVSKPFPNRPYCQATAQNIGVTNSAGSVVSFCQTVLPGDEDMLIPTTVTDWSGLAVPDPNYWAGTAAHYYINAPGVGAAEACVWGTSAKAVGNWAPYVAGANSDSTGQTFIKLGWNPVYLEEATPFRNVMPDWGVEIVCPNGGCNGLPCSIDPSQNTVNQMVGGSTSGAGGGDFCVVTVAKGSTANFVVFSSNKAGQFYQSSAPTSPSASAASSSVPPSSTAPSSTASTSAVASTIGSSTTSQHSASSSPSVSPTTSNWALSHTANSSTSTSLYSKVSTEQPYFSLFNSTVPSSTGKVGSNTPKAGAPANTNVATHTGGASSLEISSGLMALAVGAMML